jgi:hypothetical protein
MTINGKLQVAALEESITVTSQAPTIDLETSKVAVNWDQQKLDDLPNTRAEFGNNSGAPARTHGGAGGNVLMYDGMSCKATTSARTSSIEATHPGRTSSWRFAISIWRWAGLFGRTVCGSTPVTG